MNNAVADELQLKVDFLFEQVRLDTFDEKWVFDESKPCSTRKLAEAGFYYTGNDEDPDLVQCFLCDKQLVGWEENDDPWQEHCSRSPNCEFAKLGKLEGELTLAQMIHFKEVLIVNYFKTLINEREENFEKVIETIRELKKTIA